MNMSTDIAEAKGRFAGMSIAWWVVAVLGVGIGLYVLPPLVTFDADMTQIPLNPDVDWHKFVLMMHGVPGAIALVVGPFQFLPAIRKRWPRAHRYMGRVYLLAVLVGCIMGFTSALVSVSGFSMQAAFVLLALAWFYSGLKAYVAARNRRFHEHRIWMIRNYAFTFTAVTLRLILVAGRPFIDTIPGLTFPELYAFSGWGSIVICSLVAEWFVVPTARKS